jgi:two-component system phosphate regulon sensor histidine kinase PhoR
MQLKLTQLVLITCLALLSIIALQVFWLYKAYQEQKNQLLSLVDNTLMETQIFTGVNASLRTTAQSLANDILINFSKGKIDIKDTGHLQVQKKYEINMSDLPRGEENMKSEILKLIGLDTSSRKSYTLEEYKKEIAKSLSYKKVNIPFELALIASDDAIVACTTDTVSFKKSSLITGTDYSLPITLNQSLEGRVRLAFPHAVFYLLKGMWVILLLSVCFIIICAISFSYMVTLFYKQKKVAEIRNDFMNNMTHELKTPISSVSVALELLQDNSVSMEAEAKDEYFKIAGNELKRLTMLVDKVLRMAAFEKMEVKIKKEKLLAREWIKEAVNSVKPLAEAGKVAIATDIQPEDLSLFADKNHICSVLQNLLENAIKYADSNKSLLEINIAAWKEDDNFYFKVKDNGIGIAQQYHSKVFDKFFRVPTGDQHDTKGYGLGLSYVKEIVRLHQGTVTLESELRSGTTFTISIPQN